MVMRWLLSAAGRAAMPIAPRARAWTSSRRRAPSVSSKIGLTTNGAVDLVPTVNPLVAPYQSRFAGILGSLVSSTCQYTSLLPSPLKSATNGRYAVSSNLPESNSDLLCGGVGIAGPCRKPVLPARPSHMLDGKLPENDAPSLYQRMSARPSPLKSPTVGS